METKRVEMTNIVENITQSCENMGQIELVGIKLEEARPGLLDVSEMDFNKHVAAQPSAIAYYGVLRKEAHRSLSSLKRAFDRWQSKKWSEAKISVLSGASQYKPVKEDIQARFIVDNEKELEQWDNRLDKAQFEVDTIDSWYEAWRQKSFTIREWAGIEVDEKYQGSGSIVEEKSDVSAPSRRSSGKTGESKKVGLDRVRDIMKKRRENEAQGASGA